MAGKEQCTKNFWLFSSMLRATGDKQWREALQKLLDCESTTPLVRQRISTLLHQKAA